MLASAAVAILGHSTAYAQSVAPAQVRSAVDENGVDLFEGSYNVSAPSVTLGGADNGITAPEGNQVRYTYDSRGNVTEQRYVAKSSGSSADIVLTAGYDANCSNSVTCNQPNWTKDALSHQTDYTYNIPR